MGGSGVGGRTPKQRALLSARVRELALACGFSDAGVAPPDLPEAKGGLARWLEAGFQASMDWIGRSKGVRLDLRKRFSWARSVIVVTLPYRTQPLPAGGGSGLSPYVSAYARGLDYHDIVLPKLEELGASLADEFDESEIQTRAYVDTGPVLERQMAREAGLGWLGKNGLLLTPTGGSYVFLGVVITDLELPMGHAREHTRTRDRVLKQSQSRPRPPVRTRDGRRIVASASGKVMPVGAAPDPAATPARPAGSCGSCDACQPACPTDAFVSPGVLDSRRCISYLTIEHKGPIDRDLRHGMGGWLFGCDLCQTACPINRPTKAPRLGSGAPGAPFEVGEAVAGTELHELLGLDEEGFRERFEESPLSRPKRVGLLRNALIVAANLERRECVPAARKLLRDDSPVLREAASWMLAELGDRSALQDLREAVEREDEDWARALMAQDLIRALSA